MYLKLSSMIEGQLRDAYAKKYEAGALNQSSLAAKLGVNRSAVHHRLTGQTNMTIETIADMVWGLDHDIELKIFDASEFARNHRIGDQTVSFKSMSTEPANANNPLMQIASTAPSANTATLSILGGTERRVTPEAAQSYRSQLIGLK
jgi:plasmid maintenance system antidote protein VapI